MPLLLQHGNIHTSHIKPPQHKPYFRPKLMLTLYVYKDRGAQLVEALHYKPEGRGFDSRWCHWNFSLAYSFRSHYGPGVDSGIFPGG
jgi:hypothetical protein